MCAWAKYDTGWGIYLTASVKHPDANNGNDAEFFGTKLRRLWRGRLSGKVYSVDGWIERVQHVTWCWAVGVTANSSSSCVCVCVCERERERAVWVS
jgi:hypothetical protein